MRVQSLTHEQVRRKWRLPAAVKACEAKLLWIAYELLPSPPPPRAVVCLPTYYCPSCQLVLRLGDPPHVEVFPWTPPAPEHPRNPP